MKFNFEPKATGEEVFVHFYNSNKIKKNKQYDSKSSARKCNKRIMKGI